MKTEELMKHWAAWEVGVKVKDVERINISSHIGGGSHDLNSSDFSTFAGCEVFYLNVIMKDGTVQGQNLYDCNPVNSIMSYARQNKIMVKAEPKTQEELLEAELEDLI